MAYILGKITMQVNPSIASVVTPESLAARTAFAVRRKIYAALAREIDLEALESVLDVGATADAEAAYSNFFECSYPHPERITALSDQDAGSLETLFPGVRFVRGDGCRLPFPDASFDLVFSSAVLEHVGHETRQKQFIAEAVRVSRNYVFLTTPNRFHPLEFHTKLPLLHWLPKTWHRRILRRLKLDYLSEEAHLNLLSQKDLRRMCRELGLTAELHQVRFLGLPSNWLLKIVKART